MQRNACALHCYLIYSYCSSHNHTCALTFYVSSFGTDKMHSHVCTCALVGWGLSEKHNPTWHNILACSYYYPHAFLACCWTSFNWDNAGYLVKDGERFDNWDHISTLIFRQTGRSNDGKPLLRTVPLHLQCSRANARVALEKKERVSKLDGIIQQFDAPI